MDIAKTQNNKTKTNIFGSNFSKILIVLSAIILVLTCVALSGCEQEEYKMELKSPTITKANLIKEGVLTVGVDSSNPPLSNQSFAGIDIDVASAIADELGLSVEFVDVGSSSESAFILKKADIVMGVSSATKSGSNWKSDVYLETAPALFSTKASAAVPTNSDSKKYISTMGSSSVEAIQTQFGVTNVKTVTNLSEAFSVLKAGNVDFVGADAVLGTYQSLKDNIDTYIIALLAEPSGYCIEVAKDNAKLQTSITEAISKIKDNGILDVIERRWLARNLKLESVALTEGAENQAKQDSLDNAVYDEVVGTAIQN